MADTQQADVSEPLAGDQLYKRRARSAFPILVRQASVGQEVLYEDLAHELQMPNPRNLDRPLGSIGLAINTLSKTWEENIPPIQCLVINKRNGLPGEGIGEFLIDREDFAKLSRSGKRHIVRGELAKIFAYPRWHEVLWAVGLAPTRESFGELNQAAVRSKASGGESKHHEELKNHVAANPSLVALPPSTENGETEAPLPSGDSLDVSFDLRTKWAAVEVKSKISSDADIVRGLYQCVKYRAVMQAIESSEKRERSLRAVLVIEEDLPAALIPLRNVLGVEVVEGVRI